MAPRFAHRIIDIINVILRRHCYFLLLRIIHPYPRPVWLKRLGWDIIYDDDKIPFEWAAAKLQYLRIKRWSAETNTHTYEWWKVNPIACNFSFHIASPEHYHRHRLRSISTVSSSLSTPSFSSFLVQFQALATSYFILINSYQISLHYTFTETSPTTSIASNLSRHPSRHQVL